MAGECAGADIRATVTSVTSKAHLDIAADVVQLASELVNIPSESFREAPLADAVESALTSLPWLTVTRLGNSVVARTEFGRSERVVVAGHLDTVPAAGNAQALLVATGDPVPLEGADGHDMAPEERLYGLGSCDMKGGVAVALSCAASVSSPVRDVTYVLYDCEEVASVHSGLGRVVRERPELLEDADCAILMEPSDAGVEAGCQGTLRVEVHTVGRRAHSARSWLGENAIHNAAEVLNRLARYTPRHVKVDGLEFREGLNAVGIRGGAATNVIPDECGITVNYRFAPDRSEDEALAHLWDVFAGHELSVLDSAPGAEPGLARPAVADFLAVATATSPPRPKYGWTDVARFAALGVPALNFGPGDPGLAHTREEYVATAQIRSVHAVMVDWLAGRP